MKTTILTRRNLLLKIIIVLLFPTQLFSQNLVGLWTGKVYTSDKTLPYEVAISEKDGKLSGFSYTTFTVKGEEMVAVKSIVVRKEKDKIIIEDEDLVFNSFDEESPKQLKQTNTLELEVVNDKTMLLMGKFKTLKTKEFRSMTGGIRLRKDSIIEQPKLIAKLTEMDLAKSLSFLQPPTVAETETAIAKLDKVATEVEKPKPEKIVEAPSTVKTTAPVTKPVIAPIKAPAPVTTAPVAAAKPPVGTPVKPLPVPTAAAPVKKPAPVVVAAAKPAAPTPKPVVVAAKPTPAPPIAAAPAPVKKPAATNFTTNFAGRSIETIQTVAFKSDSITLTLYDNGEVDGDTVSVYANGKPVLLKQRLSTNAINYTIHITPEMGDSIQLIMYAENLGTIPPNSGLLIIKDGRDRYEIRFAGDLTKNAAITLRKKLIN